MKKLMGILSMAVVLNATTYMGKLEPYNTITISSEVSGKVVFVNEKKEFSYIKGKETIVKIETQEEDIALGSLKQSLKNQSEIFKIQKQNYINKSKVKQLSIYDKNQEKLSYLHTKQSIIELKKSIKSLHYQKDKKEFLVQDFYLGKIEIDKDETINIGVKLYNLYDFSTIKIVLYLKAEDLNTINEKKVYLNDKQSDFKIFNISKIKDNLRVSTHQVELVKPNTNMDKTLFGEIVKVEFK